MRKPTLIKSIIIAVLLVLALLGRTNHSPAMKDLLVHFIDVGYGQAILLEFSNGDFILIDTGDQKHKASLMDFLDERGVKRLESIIITHPHPDHYGNLLSLIEKYPTKSVITNGDEMSDKKFFEMINEVHERNVLAYKVKYNDRISVAPLPTHLRIIHPVILDGDVNADSLVLLLQYGNVNFLLFADNTPKVQDEIITRIKTVRSIPFPNVVTIPHHGGPLSDRFVGFFKDVLFILSTGDNIWGHPGKDDIENLMKLQGDLFRTDLHGTITVKTDGKDYVLYKKK